MQRNGYTLAATVALGVAILAQPARALPYDAEYVFGDSLSDNGNLAEIFGSNFPNPPSFHDSFTNGPVAVAGLASSIGVPLTPSLWVTSFTDPKNLFGGPSFVPGTNYAVAGATAAFAAVGGPTSINLPQQVGAYTHSGTQADPNALYVVMIGGNDVRNAAKQGTGTAAVATGVTAERAAIQTLSAYGAKNFLVVNVPNVGAIPEFAQDNPSLSPTATQLSISYDAQLATALAGTPGVTLFDLYGYANNIVANGPALGFQNTTDRCFTTTPFSAAASPLCGPNGANVNSFLYWDAIHPSGHEQALWAQGFESALGLPVAGSATVPEPSSLPLLATSLLLVLAGTIQRIFARARSHAGAASPRGA